MSIDASAALWFLPFVVPLCLYTCYTDMARMKITNPTVIALFVVFALVGLIALPFETYLWRYLHLVVVLIAGIALNAGGVMGAGDAKFAAAAAPFIHLGDLRLLLVLFTGVLIAAFVAHRLARATPLTRLAPEWQSWHSGSKFPMGLALGGALALYLGLGVLYGA
ncbi:Type IV leader peptidase family protein [Roseivivax sp. THAF40]|uniref:prepilin peptidase n=1 Tax=unclassified Roseivivax TaxID=2639302 RepID=UPI001268C96B|nr:MULTISPECIES: prepilin peptidase [unclassified Roseivivax]QFS81857.1 Type IV leader peptidase family protein [Roseivivax sp. THAF197b]QFT45657.1 Type IV leader peptidase family protein [Roseivivax sp. THAF40]